jgi:hypothetical protein
MKMANGNTESGRIAPKRYPSVFVFFPICLWITDVRSRYHGILDFAQRRVLTPMIAKSDTANTQNSAAISGCERRFVRRFAGRHWDLVSREEILRAVGESPVCYDDACDPGRTQSSESSRKRN